MVYTSKTYHCSKCRKSFRSVREAESCEIDHIVKASVDGFAADLSSILSTPATTTEGENG